MKYRFSLPALRGWTLDFTVLIVAAVIGWFWLVGPSHPDFEGRIADDNHVVMYSMLRCQEPPIGFLVAATVAIPVQSAA